MASLLKYAAQIVNHFHHARMIRAHCDVPCGIYTAHQAGIAAETVEKMVQKLRDLAPLGVEASQEEKFAWHNTMVRAVQTKEEWARTCKQELLILWTDYFKQDHLAIVPDLHEKIWKAAKLCSQNKREVNLQAAQDLRKAVDEIADIFKKTEGEKAIIQRQEWL